MNLFGTVLTYTAPSSNYRGESAENRAIIQKITRGRFEHAIISPEAMRNALRECMQALGLPCNRARLHDAEQLAVAFRSYPNPEEYADDFFMGWLIAAGEKDRKSIEKELDEKGRNPKEFSFKQDSILRMNMAVALEPYRFDTVFTQSPQDKTDKDIKKHVNTENSQLLHRETTFTAYQYPFALNLNDCSPKAEWTKTLLSAIGQLKDVAGNHARSYFEMAPASIILRLTNQLVAGYNTYGFEVTDEGRHILPEIISGLKCGDYPGSEFFIAGKVIKDMNDEEINLLKNKDVTVDRNPQNLLKIAGEAAFISG